MYLIMLEVPTGADNLRKLQWKVSTRLRLIICVLPGKRDCTESRIILFRVFLKWQSIAYYYSKLHAVASSFKACRDYC